MFGIERERLLKEITVMQRSRCGYDMLIFPEPPSFCDCKYGYDPKNKYGEQTGCPELRLVCSILSVMTNDEYENFMIRAGNIL